MKLKKITDDEINNILDKKVVNIFQYSGKFYWYRIDLLKFEPIDNLEYLEYIFNRGGIIFSADTPMSADIFARQFTEFITRYKADNAVFFPNLKSEISEEELNFLFDIPNTRKVEKFIWLKKLIKYFKK